jgi:hypothetical protein
LQCYCQFVCNFEKILELAKPLKYLLQVLVC